jgi:metal-dependent amidase/aminoacylase/carboxypeptidase family protein
MTDRGLARLERDMRRWLDDHAGALDVSIGRQDHFNATLNDPDAARYVDSARQELSMPKADFDFPMRPSEDFGAFSTSARCALFFLGAGEAQPPLHDPAYDFPDALIAPGVSMFRAILAQIGR